MRLKLKDCSILFFLLTVFNVSAQYKVSGKVTDVNGKLLNEVEIIDLTEGYITETNTKGLYEFSTPKKKITVYIFADGYKLNTQTIELKDSVTTFNFTLAPLSEQLTEIEITAQRRKVFELTRLKDVEGTAIYAGKKTEVIQLAESTVNMASNNARQIYSQIAGLNIYENDDAGLQLNIGGRGLDPNRTANFNTRQNGYDISADVLGYPESYYTPPAEAIENIQIIRGAASLQYGTQFGGLVNFVLKKPNPNKELEIITRNTLGSNGLFTNFTSVSGTKNKFSYNTYYNYKMGDGFRDNSEFNAKNLFAQIGYEISDKTKIEAEITYMDYLAKQAGGLTDSMFAEDPYQSNRTRNWFKVDWFLYNLKFDHKFSDKTNFTFNFFGLNASRKAVGFRGNPYPTSVGLNTPPISEEDVLDSDGTFFYNRDIIINDFNNWGIETRLLHKYNFLSKDNVFLIGAKYYNANNSGEQGAGSKLSDADFAIDYADNEFYPNVSSLKYPNKNLAIFGENIFKFSDKFTITPGFRFENIETSSSGLYYKKNYDNAENLIFSEELEESVSLNRSFVLLGLGVSYKPFNFVEIYGNISENYRSVTFNDIRTISPSFVIDENIKDESGFTIDLGFRGNFKKILSYDAGVFMLSYNDRLGSYNNRSNLRVRTNIGDAIVYGVESYTEWNVLNTFTRNNNFQLKLGVNFAYLNSEYTKVNLTDTQNVVVSGNKVEFIPDVNLKTILKLGYKNFTTSIQYSYLSDQFTDAENSSIAPSGNLREGIVGEIPAYDVLDFSASYKYKRFKLEVGINNILDNAYFTRRATGYPGPGIIPSAPRTFYTTLQIKI